MSFTKVNDFNEILTKPMDKGYISDLIERYKLTPKKLANAIGVDPSYLSLVINGKRNVSDSLKYKLEKYEELRIKANDIIENVIEPWSIDKTIAEESAPYTRRRPARGGRGPAPTQRKPRLAHMQHIIALFTEWLEKMPDGQYDMFPVEGTSMLPTVCEGDELVCKMVTVDEIIDGRVYVLVLNKPELTEYRESGIWVKRVYHRKKNEYLSCKSDNKESTEPFITFQVSVADVEQVWYICGRLTGYLADPNRDIYERLDEIESRLEMLEADAGME